ncbi:MAG TPA: choice-of-anchor L domain-containing protein [Acidimicrobiia bacterium]
MRRRPLSALVVSMLAAATMLFTVPVVAEEPRGGSTKDPGVGIQLVGGDVQDLTDGLTPTDVAQTLVGPGVTISSVSYTGIGEALGTFSESDDPPAVGIADGVILGSGFVKDVVGPNSLPNTSRMNGTPGDADLTALSGFPTLDSAVLTFDFEVPEFAERISMRYVFGSEEYNEYIGTQFNDVFAFFVNGENCATVETSPVSINTINNGADPNVNGATIAATNPGFYVNNDPFNPDGTGATLPAAPHNTEMDGFTVVLTCEAEVSDTATNTMKIAIADASDRVLDSWVLLEAASLTIIPLDVTKHWSQTDVCFLGGGDPAEECPDGTSLGTPLPIDEDGDFQIEAVVNGKGVIASYNPGQVYAVSSVRVLGDVAGLTISEIYQNCTTDTGILTLNPAPGRGGGSVVVVVLNEEGDPVQILDANSPEVTAGVDESIVMLGPLDAGTTVLVYVKFGPGLKGETFAGPLSCTNVNSAQAFDAAGAEFGEEISDTAVLELTEKS